MRNFAFIQPGFIPVLLSIGVLSSPLRAQDCEGWTQVGEIPGGRSGHAMAYDSVRGVTVLFGGSDSKSYLNDTWEWDGTFWTRKEAAGPPPRAGHALSYDSFRRVVVLFGGSDEFGVLGDTWEWNGSVWTQRVGTGPEARYGHALSYDGTRRVVVLFGGRTDGAPVPRHVWEWNGAVWTRRNGIGPTPRDGVTMAFDPVRNVTVLFGGGLGTRGVSSETWEWNGTSWSLRSTAGPRAQANPQLVFDTLRFVILMFGEGTVAAGETWEWNGASWLLRTTAGAPYREGQAAAYDTVRHRMVLFGGDNPARNETWEWDGTAWANRGGDTTRTRSGTAMAYDSARQRVVVFGGAVDGVEANRTLEWDGTQWNIIATAGPAARDSHALAYDPVRGVTLLFGGRSAASDTTDGGTGNDFVTEFDDTWGWNGAVWSLLSSTGPSPRYGHTMSFDARRGVMVLFGGATFNGSDEIAVRDTWEWNGTVWSRRATTGPSARLGQAMTFDSDRGLTLLFGGKQCTSSCCTVRSDTWVWDGFDWVQRPVAGPSARFGSAMTYDTVGGLPLLFGGQDMTGVLFADLWQWDGTAWTQRADVGPRARSGHAMIYDVAERATVLFGGVGGNGEMWQYGCDASCGDSQLTAPTPELFSDCPGGPCYVPKSRYLSFAAPAPPCGSTQTALRVTFGPLPGPSNCPGIPDFSRFNGSAMWVGAEHLFGEYMDQPTGVFELQSTPRFRDWRSVTGGIVHVSDCNIVPCGSYTIQAVTKDGFPLGEFSAPMVLTTRSVWGDVVGPDGIPFDDLVNALDVVGAVDRFRNVQGSPQKSWCDLATSRPWQGAFADIDALDVTMILDAFRGLGYPYSGPSAPGLCTGAP